MREGMFTVVFERPEKLIENILADLSLAPMWIRKIILSILYWPKGSFCGKPHHGTHLERVIWQKPSAKLQNTEKEDNAIRQKAYSESQTKDESTEKTKNFTLSWSHYLVLMRIENPAERSFYEIEANNQQWSL